MSKFRVSNINCVGLAKSQEFVIFSISHLMISMGYDPGLFEILTFLRMH